MIFYFYFFQKINARAINSILEQIVLNLFGVENILVFFQKKKLQLLKRKKNDVTQTFYINILYMHRNILKQNLIRKIKHISFVTIAIIYNMTTM